MSLIGLGQGFGLYIATTTIANNWFMRRRSLAVSLVVVLGGLGGFAGPSLIGMLIPSIGWRLTWVCLGGILLVLSVVIGGLLIRNRPEDLGQLPDGEVREKNTTKAPSRVYQTPVDWEVRDALHTPALWLIVIFSGANLLAVLTMTTHLVAYLQDIGLSLGTAAFILGLAPGMSIMAG